MTQADIFHILDADAWTRAQQAGVHAPAELARDGFLHCCRRSQLGFVAARFFAGRAGMLVLRIDPSACPGELRWERSEPDQDSFPHLFGPVPIAAVRGVEPLDLLR